MRRYQYFSLIAALAFLGANLGACSLGSSAESEETKAVKAFLSDTREAAGPKVKPMSVDTNLPEIESRVISVGDEDLKLTLNSVLVSDGLTSVVFSVKNEAKSSSYASIGGVFDDGTSAVPKDEDGTQGEEMYNLASNTTDGVIIVDGKNKMVYRAAYDKSGHCLCSSNLNDYNVREGQSFILQTTFAELPKDVKSVTVSIPRAGTFNDVKVTR